VVRQSPRRPTWQSGGAFHRSFLFRPLFFSSKDRIYANNYSENKTIGAAPAVRTIALLAPVVASTGYGQESPLAERIPEIDAARLTVGPSAPALAFGKDLASLQERNCSPSRGRWARSFFSPALFRQSSNKMYWLPTLDPMSDSQKGETCD